MKKILNLKGLLVVAGFALTIIAFIVAFFAGISHTGEIPLVGKITTELRGIIIGGQSMITSGSGNTTIGKVDDPYYALVSLIAIIVALVVAGLSLLLMLLSKKQPTKLLIVAGGIVLVAGILIFFSKSFLILHSATVDYNKGNFLPGMTLNDGIDFYKDLYGYYCPVLSWLP